MLAQRDYAQALEPLLQPAARYAMSILRNRADAEDAVQAAALRGLERLASFDESRPFKGWWFAVLHNCCIDRLRRSRRFPAAEVDIDAVADVAEEPAPDWAALDLALQGLPERQAEVVRMHYFAGLRYREIAEALSIPIGTVMSRLHSARQSLAQKLKEEA
jgi:RNA polymerase sigma-70 factor (ECF subfamily)